MGNGLLISEGSSRGDFLNMAHQGTNSNDSYKVDETSPSYEQSFTPSQATAEALDQNVLDSTSHLASAWTRTALSRLVG